MARYICRMAPVGQSGSMTTDEPPEIHYILARAGLQLLPGGGAFDVLIEGWRERLAYKARRTVAEVVEATGVETLAQRLADDPEVEALFVQGLDAATRTGYEAKRRLLAQLISAAVLDDAKVDEALLYVLALGSLEAPHIRALEAMWRAAERARGGDPARSKTERAIAEREAVRQATRGLSWAICAALAREGLVINLGTIRATPGKTFEDYEVTSFGIDLLDHIREVEVVSEGRD